MSRVLNLRRGHGRPSRLTTARVLTGVWVALAVGPLVAFGQTALEQEIGENDFRISSVGGSGDTARDGERPAAAYNEIAEEVLVVWQGNNSLNDLEIWGQRVDATTGESIGSNFRISTMGTDGSAASTAEDPAVAFNSTSNEYLVVWEGTDDPNDREIWAQRVDADNGALRDANFRVSDLGPDGNADYDARNPAVTYNPNADEYLVIFHGDNNANAVVEGENEIWGQRLNGSSGAAIGENDFRISLQGVNGETKSDAENGAVAYNSTTDEYLVVWEGDQDEFGTVNGEFEIWGRRLEGANGATIGNDFRITRFGPNENNDFDAVQPDLAFNSSRNTFLLVWQGDDFSSNAGTETEIFGLRLNSQGAGIGTEFAISQMGPIDQPGFDPYDAEDPSVAYFAAEDEFFVVWSGDDDTQPLVNDEFEVFGQRVSGTGSDLVESALRLSDLGPDGATNFNAVRPEVVSLSAAEELLVVFSGDDDTEPLVEGELEIFGQRLDFKLPSDLVIEAFTATCNANDTLNVSLDISNGGERNAAPFSVGIYGSLGTDVTTQDKLLGTVTFASGVEGEAATQLVRNLPTANVQDGTYFIGAIADFESVVGESDETNNTFELGERKTIPCATAACELADQDLVLENQILGGVQTLSACYTITLGSGLVIPATADITLRAGQGFLFESGVSVLEGASFEAEVDSSLRQ